MIYEMDHLRMYLDLGHVLYRNHRNHKSLDGVLLQGMHVSQIIEVFKSIRCTLITFIQY